MIGHKDNVNANEGKKSIMISKISKKYKCNNNETLFWNGTKNKPFQVTENCLYESFLLLLYVYDLGWGCGLLFYLLQLCYIQVTRPYIDIIIAYTPI